MDLEKSGHSATTLGLPCIACEVRSQITGHVGLDTGGGDLLAGLPYRPERTVATESYPPNVPVAARRLRPLDVPVIEVEGAPDNNVQKDKIKGHLPFRTGSFHLVVNRHASFVAKEASRILAPGGSFITQQVGEQKYNDFHQLLGLPFHAPSSRPWTLDLAKAQLEAANLQFKESAISTEVMSFSDIGAFAWYLKNPVDPLTASPLLGIKRD